MLAADKGVIGRGLTGGGFDYNKTSSDSTVDVLGHLRPEIPVESVVAATERGAVMLTAQRLEAKRALGHSSPNSWRYRLTAFLRAGVSAGGLRIAAAIWR
jgi:hypothetical protein